MLQRVTTKSGTYYLIDPENMTAMRVSPRVLHADKDGRAANYFTLKVINGPEADYLYIVWTDGSWTQTSYISSVKYGGKEQDVLITGPAFLAGVNPKYDAVEVRKYNVS